MIKVYEKLANNNYNFYEDGFKKRKIAGFKVFDPYEIMDLYGSYTVILKLFKGGKYLGRVKIS